MKNKLLSLFVALMCASSLFADFNIRLGDVTGNDTINEADIDALGEYIVGRTPEGFVLEAADYNQDGRISVLDVRSLNEYVLRGGDVEFYCKKALLQFYEAVEGERTLGDLGWNMDTPTDTWQGVILNPIAEVPYLELFLDLKDSTYFPEDLPAIQWLTKITIFGNSFKIAGSPWKFIAQHSDLELLELWNVYGIGTFPEEIRGLNKLTYLEFCETDLHGTIPDWLYDLTELKYLILVDNYLEGEISPKIAQLKKLNVLRLYHVGTAGCFSGEILPYICDLPLYNVDLRCNNFSGTLPREFTKLLDIRSRMMSMTEHVLFGCSIKIGLNRFSGMIPSCIYEHPAWKYCWAEILDGTPFMNASVEIIPAPDYNLIDTKGVSHSSKDYSSHKLTLICQWDELSISIGDLLTEWYNQYGDKGLEILGYASIQNEELLNNIIVEQNIQWPVINGFDDEHNNHFKGYENVYTYPTNTFPAIEIIDSTGTMVYTTCISNSIDIVEIENILARYCQVPSEVDYYRSTDYSQDGRVDTLQLASAGNGINLVLMGDGFSDRQIANGTYRQHMERAVEAFFLEEPYHSYRNLFNVFIVNVVSSTEGYAHGGQRLGTGFGGDTYVFGNDAACVYYANKAVSEDQMENLGIIVLMDSAYYAGTCYMYYPTKEADFGSGLSISYFPLGTDSVMFNGIVQHEAGGHGFGKLADEYCYDYMGEISEKAINQNRTFMSYHWYDNVDFTSDSSLVKWAHFLNDSRYNNQGLGCYEGGLTYASGVWRPTETSIMRFNTDGFNAPSREAIWYRMHKLAYGDSRQYNYEDFVAYDAINRISTEASQPQHVRKMPRKEFVPLHAPVIRTENWREMLKEQKPIIPVSLRSSKKQQVSREQIAPKQAPLRNAQLNQQAQHLFIADTIIIKRGDSICFLGLISTFANLDAWQFDLIIPQGLSYYFESADSSRLVMDLSPTMRENTPFIKTGFVSDSCMRILCADLSVDYKPLTKKPREIPFNIPLRISTDIVDNSLIKILNNEQLLAWEELLYEEYNEICHIRIQEFTIDVFAENGSVDGAGTYDYGTEVTLIATPNEGYEFDNWSNGITDNPYTFIVEQDVELTANFIKKFCTSWQDINSEIKVIKYFENERLIIERNGVKYTSTGQKVR